MILTYSDFTFDNVNFNLEKRSSFKHILELLNIRLVLKLRIPSISNLLGLIKQIGTINQKLKLQNIPYKHNNMLLYNMLTFS